MVILAGSGPPDEDGRDPTLTELLLSFPRVVQGLPRAGPIDAVVIWADRLSHAEPCSFRPSSWTARAMPWERVANRRSRTWASIQSSSSLSMDMHIFFVV